MKKLFFVILMFGITMSIFSGQGEEKIVIKEVDGFVLAAVDHTGSFEQMEKAVQAYMGEFFKQGLAPDGPFIGVYYNSPTEVKPDELKWSIGFPVSKDAEIKTPMKKKEFKKMKAAVYLYTGPYEKMHDMYEMVFDYVKKKGYKIIWPTIDRYLNNPMEVKPEDLKTEIIVPIQEK